MKIVYKVVNGTLKGYRNDLIDENEYTLKQSEVFGDKFNRPIWDGNDIIEGQTQTDIDNAQIAEEDAEDEAEENQREQDGLKLIIRTRKRLRRKVKKSNLTQNQSKKVRRLFSNIFVHLRNGDWDLASEDVDLIPSQSVQKIQNEVDWLSTKINEY